MVAAVFGVKDSKRRGRSSRSKRKMAQQCNTDDLRLILSRLTPAMVRLVRAVAKTWLAAADHSCLWQAHLRGRLASCAGQSPVQ